jgi:NAD(P)-dependent dehydrogenase (short-subunit alcohol dehydrogenase family)
MNTILITGCNRGIGLEFVRQYAADGWRVYATCRTPDSAQELKALSGKNSSISIHALNVASEENINLLAKQLHDIKLDILLNNAGIYASGGNRFGSIDKTDWLKAFEINTIAPLLMAQAFLNQLLAGKQKIIAAVSSKMGSLDDNTSGGVYAYRTSKAAVNQVMKSLAIDLESQGIKTVALHPGWVKTDMGGPDALIDTRESVTGMRKVLSQLSRQQSGQFIGYDGALIPW